MCIQFEGPVTAESEDARFCYANADCDVEALQRTAVVAAGL